MKTIKGFILGGVIVGVIGFALGYNYGRGAPLLTNPFDKYTLKERLNDTAAQIAEEAKQRLDEASQ
jgi:hypothetical protein